MKLWSGPMQQLFLLFVLPHSCFSPFLPCTNFGLVDNSPLQALSQSSAGVVSLDVDVHRGFDAVCAPHCTGLASAYLTYGVSCQSMQLAEICYFYLFKIFVIRNSVLWTQMHHQITLSIALAVTREKCRFPINCFVRINTKFSGVLKHWTCKVTWDLVSVGILHINP